MRRCSRAVALDVTMQERMTGLDMLSLKIAPAALPSSWRRTAVVASICFVAASLVMGPPASGANRSRPSPRAEVPEVNSLLGSYLAGHVARSTRDSDNAALYYRRALAKDPANQDILEEAFQLDLAAGEFDSARSLAQRLVRKQTDNTIAHVFLGLDAFKHRDYARADEHFRNAERGTSAEEPTIKLARAWVAVAQGRADKAIAALQSPSKAAWATHFETVQRAFIGDVARKKAVALEAYRAVTEKKAPNTRIAEAFARHLAFWGDREQAEAVLKEAGADVTPIGKQLMAELKAGKTPKLMVANAEEGLAELFLGIGQVLATNNGADAAQIYLRLALFLNPASDIAKLELAELYGSGNSEQYDKAIAVIDTVRENSPFWINSKTPKSDLLECASENGRGGCAAKGSS